jgi:hypothetical protein
MRSILSVLILLVSYSSWSSAQGLEESSRARPAALLERRSASHRKPLLTVSNVSEALTLLRTQPIAIG